MSAEQTFKDGDRVTRSGYEGTVICEYLPGMYEVRLSSGVVVVPGSELSLASSAR